MAKDVPRLAQLLIQYDKEENKKEISDVLDLCDLIYFTGKPQLHTNDMEYGLNDLPDDVLYDAMRLKYTPGVKAGDNLPKDILSAKEKVEHTHAMGSLVKYGESTFDQMMKLFKNVKKIIIMEKLDGMSTRTYYDDGGKMTLAVTRHKDNLGRNVTSKVENIYPKWTKSKAIINGETMLIGDAYEKLNMANRRNAIGGILGRDEIDPEIEKDIRYFAYEFVEGAPSENQAENLEALKEAGFRIPRYEVVDEEKINSKMLKALFDEWYEKSSPEYDIDGIVLSPLVYTFENEEKPTMKIAYKVQLPGAWTVVTDVKSICTRQGFVIPHIQVEPVIVEGAKLTYVSGANYDLLREREIIPGSRVYVIRSKGVIPFIDAVDNEQLGDEGVVVEDELKRIIPTHCPCCGTKLIQQVTQSGAGKMLYCPNEQCPAKLDGNLIYFFIMIGVKHVGKILLGNLGAKSIEDVYAMSLDDIMQSEGFGKGRAELLYNQIRTAITNIEDATLLAAMGIPMVSKKTAELIMNELTIDEIFAPTTEKEKVEMLQKLTAIDGMGMGKAKQVVGFIPRGQDMLKFLYSQGMKVQKRKMEIMKREGIYGKKFVMTGKGKLKRFEYERAIRQAGGKTTGTVSKSTDYLVTDNVHGMSSKLRKATELGVPIITYDKLEKMLGL